MWNAIICAIFQSIGSVNSCYEKICDLKIIKVINESFILTNHKSLS
jgi:hypothetical protein